MSIPLWLAVLASPALVASAAADWKEYRAPDGKFLVRFPAQPKETAQDFGNIKLKRVTCSVQDNDFFVTYADLPFLSDEPRADLVETSFESARKAILAGYKGSRLIDEKKIKLADKYPGRDLVMTFELPGNMTGRIRVRIFLVGKTQYQVMVAGTDAFVQSKDAERFLDSFALTK